MSIEISITETPSSEKGYLFETVISSTDSLSLISLEELHKKMLLQQPYLANGAILTVTNNNAKLTFKGITTEIMAVYLLLFRKTFYSYFKEPSSIPLPSLKFISKGKTSNFFFILLDPSLGREVDEFLLLVLLENLRELDIKFPCYSEEVNVVDNTLNYSKRMDLFSAAEFFKKLQQVSWKDMVENANTVMIKYHLPYRVKSLYPAILNCAETFSITEILKRKDLSEEFKNYVNTLSNRFAKAQNTDLRILPYPCMSYHPNGDYSSCKPNNIIPYHQFNNNTGQWDDNVFQDLKKRATQWVADYLKSISFSDTGKLFFCSEFLVDSLALFPEFDNSLAALSYHLREKALNLESLYFTRIVIEKHWETTIDKVEDYFPVIIQAPDSSLYLLKYRGM